MPQTASPCTIASRTWCLPPWILRTAVLAGALLTFGPPPLRADAIDDYNVAYNFYREHQWDHAGEAFRKFVATYPDHERTPAARLYQGLCLVQERKFGPARDVFRLFVQKHPQHPDLYLALYRIGECSYFLGDSAAAKTELDRFISTFPKNDLAQWALQYLADTYLRLKDPAAALATLKLQLERFPEGELADDARFLTGRAKLAQGDRAAAIATFQQLAAKEASLRGADANVELGMLLYEEGQYAAARDAFDAVQSRFPQSPLVGMADLNAGYACYHLADFDAAIARFDRAALVPAQSSEARFWKGMSLKTKGDYREAVATLDELAAAVAGTPLAEKAAFHSADAELRSGDYAAAQMRFLKIVDRAPSGPLAADALHLATEAALLQGDLDAADQLHARFEREFPSHGLWLLQRLVHGRVALARGDLAFDAMKSADAAQHYEAAAAEFAEVVRVSQVPRTSHLARLLLARARDRQERYQDVVDALQPVVNEFKAAAADPEFAEALLLAARAQLKLDHNDAAAETAQLFVDRFPGHEQVGAALADLALAHARLQHQADVDAALTKMWQSEALKPLARRTTYQLAEQAYAREQWLRAAALFERLTQEGAGEFETAALSGLGYARHKAGEYAAAAAAFEKLAADPQASRELAADAAHMRALSLRLADQLEPAAEAYQAAIRQFALPAGTKDLTPEDVKVVGTVTQCALGLARLRRDQQQVAPADEAYSQAVAQAQLLPAERQGELDALLQEWALFHYNAQRYDQSDAVWLKLVELRPNSPLADDARLYCGESRFFGGHFDEARQIFRQLVENPQADGFVQQRAFSLLLDLAAEDQNWAEAIRTATEFQQRFPQSDQRFYAQYRLGEAQLQSREFDAAARTLTGLHDSTDAAIRGAEWFPSARLLLAEALLQKSPPDYDGVERVVARFRSDDPNSPLLYQADEILGRRYKNQARWDEARAALKRVVDSKTGFRTETAAKAQLLIAETYLLQENYADAVTEYYKVYLNYRFPDYQAPALYQAGQCDERLNRWEGAVKSYETLLEMFPEHEFAMRAEAALKQARTHLPTTSLTPSPPPSN